MRIERGGFLGAVLRDRQAWLIIVPILGVLGGASILEAVERRIGAAASSPLTTGGGFLLIFAIPYAAIRIVELERDRRLDQLRLTGVPAFRLLADLLTSFAAPWALAGTTCLLLAAFVDAGQAGALRFLAVEIGAGMAVASVALAFTPAHGKVDMRIVTVGGATLAGSLAMLLDSSRGPALNAAFDVVIADWTWFTILALEASVAAICFPAVLRRISYPQRRGASDTGSRPEWLVRHAPYYIKRGLANSAIAAAALTASLVALLAAVRALVRDFDPGAAMVLGFLPWFVGAVVASTTARADLESGRLDLLRLASARPSLAALRHVLDVTLPFIVAGVTLVLAAVGMGAAPDDLFVIGTILAVVFLAPLAVLEGWHRSLILSYVLPAALLTFMLLPQTRWVGLTSFIALLSIIWIPWAAVIGMMRRGAGAANHRLFGACGVAAIAFAVNWGPTGPRLDASPVPMVIMLVVAGWFDDASRPAGAPVRWPLVVFGLGVVTHGYMQPWSEVLFTAVMPAIGLAAGVRLHRAAGPAHPARSFAMRVAVAFITLAGDSSFMRFVIFPMTRTTDRETIRLLFRIAPLWSIVLLLLACGLVAAVARLARTRLDQPAASPAATPRSYTDR